MYSNDFISVNLTILFSLLKLKQSIFQISVLYSTNLYFFYFQYLYNKLLPYQKNMIKNSAKSNTFVSSKSSFYKPNDQSDMIETQYSNFTSDKDQDFNDSNDPTLEQDCLIKLKDQRQKIQQLSYLYQKTLEQMKKEQEKVQKLQLQLGNQQELKTIKLKYLALCKQYQETMGQNSILQNQNQKLREKLTQVTKQNQKIQKITAFEKARIKDEHNIQNNRYEQAVKDREDQITRNLNVYQIKQKQYLEDIYKLNQVIKELKQNMAEAKRQSESQVCSLTAEIVKRQNCLEKLKKAMDNIKQQNYMLRSEVKELQNQFLSKEQEWLQAQDNLIFEINNLKRKCSDYQHRLNETKYQIQKLEQKNAQSTQEASILKESLKTLQIQSIDSLNQLTHSFQQKNSQYKYQIQELKQSVQQLLEVKTLFNKENQILKEKLSKQQDQRMKRRQMMRSQLRQIQKMQNSVKRVL